MLCHFTHVAAQGDSAQYSVARFYADPSRIVQGFTNNPEYKSKLMEMEWRIHGQVLHWGSDTLRVAVDEALDTIFFKEHAQDTQLDTFICNIREPVTCIFMFNACCGAFNVHQKEMGNGFISGSVEFSVRHGKRKSLYAGRMDDGAVIVRAGGPAVVQTHCRSVMHPNIYDVRLGEIVECKDTADCYSYECMFESGSEEANGEFMFRDVGEEFFHFRYLPLSVLPLRVTYDVQRKELHIE